MTTSLLVSKLYAALFTRISLLDVYIPSPSYADHFQHLLARAMHAEDNSPPAHLCRSLTFQLFNADVYPPPVRAEDAAPRGPVYVEDGVTIGEGYVQEKADMGTALSDTLYAITRIYHLPNLRHISIEHTNWGFSHIFDERRLVDFPESVRRLDVSFAFDEWTPGHLLEALRSGKVCRVDGEWGLPGVEVLGLVGAGPSFVEEMKAVCPNLKKVSVDGRGAIRLPNYVPDVLIRYTAGIAEFVGMSIYKDATV
jgi:hypothetical protein